MNGSRVCKGSKRVQKEEFTSSPPCGRILARFAPANLKSTHAHAHHTTCDRDVRMVSDGVRVLESTLEVPSDSSAALRRLKLSGTCSLLLTTVSPAATGSLTQHHHVPCAPCH